MAEDRPQADAGLRPLDALAAAADAAARGPKDTWNPPDCGDIPMHIARDGSWHYAGSPITRPALVRLFAGILRREGERYVLVTPVEKVGITVEDAPFVATDAQWEGQTLRLRTNCEEWLSVGAAHPLRFELGPSDGLKPYVRVRGDLWALLTRPLATDLMDRAEVRTVDGVAQYGLAVADAFFAFGSAAEMGDDDA